jgi:hypothetical protein
MVLMLVLVPIHVLVVVYAFNMNTLAWVETGRMLAGGAGADPDQMNKAVRIGYQFYKGTFALFGLEFLILVAVLIKSRSKEAIAVPEVDSDIDQEHAWSISARLAATAVADEAMLPESIAGLVREARGLHPVMAR